MLALWPICCVRLIRVIPGVAVAASYAMGGGWYVVCGITFYAGRLLYV